MADNLLVEYNIPFKPAIKGKSIKFTGVEGESDHGRGVLGVSKSGHGVSARSDTGFGMVAISIHNIGIKATASDAEGVLGESQSGPGVHGTSETGHGVLGESKGLNGVVGITQEGEFCGVEGISRGIGTGVYGNSEKGTGVQGKSVEGIGVLGVSQNSEGVRGVSNNRDHAGVIGINTEAGIAVFGTSDESVGIWGTSKNSVGVHGETNSATNSAIAAFQMNANSDSAALYAKHTGNKTAAFFEGNVEITGELRFSNADFAEDFDVIENCESGEVMVLTEKGILELSAKEYDKKVVGVISGAGGYKPGIIFDKQNTANRRPIAMLGKVYCKVEADTSPIEKGDMLTTSNIPGHAMKVSDPYKAFGAVIGKALGSLSHGKGLIPMLVVLQ